MSSDYNLLNPRPTYKPFDYNWAYDAYRIQNQIHWLPEEVPMDDDIQDFKAKLTKPEINLLTQVLRFFVQSDLEVQNNYMTNLGQKFRTPEVAMMLMSFANMEGIHQQAYSHLIDTLGLPESEYNAFLSYKEMKEKCEYIHKFNVASNYELAKTLVTFGAFLEGVQLFSSFAILMNFPRRGIMKGVGKIIKFSIKDESLHSRSMAKLFKTFDQEFNIRSSNEEFDLEIYKICNEMIVLEDRFIDLCFEMGAVEGLTAQSIKDYIRFIADVRLIDFGFQPIYKIAKDPIPWLADMIGGKEVALFFEQKVSEYSKNSLTGSINFDAEIQING